MRSSRNPPGRRDSNETASGEPGAVHEHERFSAWQAVARIDIVSVNMHLKNCMTGNTSRPSAISRTKFGELGCPVGWAAKLFCGLEAS